MNKIEIKNWKTGAVLLSICSEIIYKEDDITRAINDDSELFNRLRKETRYRSDALDLSFCDFQGKRIEYFNFSDLMMKYSKFNNLRLRGCDFSHVDLEGAVFHGAYLEYADFSGAKLIGADFTGAHYENPCSFDEAIVDAAALSTLDIPERDWNIKKRPDGLFVIRFSDTNKHRYWSLD